MVDSVAVGGATVPERSPRPRPLTPPTPLSHRPPPDRERGEGQKRRPCSWLFSLFSRSGGGRWEKRAGVMRGLAGGRREISAVPNSGPQLPLPQPPVPPTGAALSPISFVFSDLTPGSSLALWRRRNEHLPPPSVARRSGVMNLKRIAL